MPPSREGIREAGAADGADAEAAASAASGVDAAAGVDAAGEARSAASAGDAHRSASTVEKVANSTPDALEHLLRRYELEHGAEVVRTPDRLRSLTLDQPGPEVIRSGTVNETGIARWRPPQFDASAACLVFYANQPRPDRTADFLCVRMNVYTGESSIEVVDTGWYEIAFDFSAAPELLKK